MADNHEGQPSTSATVLMDTKKEMSGASNSSSVLPVSMDGEADVFAGGDTFLHQRVLNIIKECRQEADKLHYDIRTKADEMIAAAKKQADRIRNDAKKRSQEAIRNAHRECEQAVQQTEAAIEASRQEALNVIRMVKADRETIEHLNQRTIAEAEEVSRYVVQCCRGLEARDAYRQPTATATATATATDGSGPSTAPQAADQTASTSAAATTTAAADTVNPPSEEDKAAQQ